MRPPTVQQPYHHILNGALGPGVVLAASAVAREEVPVLGALRGRVRIKLSAGAGTLTLRFAKPDPTGGFAEDGSRNHTYGSPTDIAASTTEAGRDIEFWGEALLILELTAGGGGATIEDVTVTLT